MKRSRTLNLPKRYIYIYVLANKTQKFNKSKTKTMRKYSRKMWQKPTKKANPSLLKKVNIEAKEIAKEFNLDDKLNIMAKQQDSVTIKDDKLDFCTNPK